LTQPIPEQQSRLKAVEAISPRPQPKFLQLRDFRKYQHYKERRPPWVKLHGEQIEDYEFQQLPDATRFHAFALVWLASKTDNKIPYDANWIGTRIGAHEVVNLAALVEAGFLEAWQPRACEAAPGEQIPLPSAEGTPSDAGTTASGDASKLLASCYQSASTETDTETETETETDTETDTAPASAGCGRAGRVCVCCGQFVFSEFSFNEALSLAKQWKREGRIIGGRPIENPGGLARKLHREGTADAEIAEFLHPPAVAEKRAFTAQACKVCFGSKMESVPKGSRHCTHCVDEQGRRTGLEPEVARDG
jgi:hypothetical protein